MARINYKDWITDDGLLKIESWASDGLLNKDIAENIGVAEGTFNNWIGRHSAISDAVKRGRTPVVRSIENALITKAKGFEYEEITTEIYMDANGKKKQNVKKHKKYSPPDTSAAIFLLKNYKPNKYRNYNDLTKKQIEAELRKTEAEIDKINFDMQADEDNAHVEVVIVNEWGDGDEEVTSQD